MPLQEIKFYFMEMLKKFIFALLGGFALGVLVHAQDQSGFISLDCGSPKDSDYTENTTSIHYISDANFIETGTNKSILQEFRTNIQPLWYVRSFPEGTRNCYNLNLTRDDRYLIRATFLYGNYDEINKAPEFDLYLGPNFWASVKIQNASTPVVMEMIHVLSSKYLHVCLVNKDLGTPFMSALELRLLSNNTYVTQNGSLELFRRLDFGSTTNSTIRYKEDVYDREWFPFNHEWWTQLSTTPPNISWKAQNNYQPPPLAMRTAATPKIANSSLDFELPSNDPNSQFYVYMHFAEVEELQANESREFNITLNNDHWFGPLVPDYLSTTTVNSPEALTGGKYVLSIFKTEKSTHPPIINAIEVYTVKELLQSQTNQIDVDAIKNIKSTYGVKRNWQGDPCAPKDYLWDGLNCSYKGYGPPRITSLNLSTSGLTGEIPLYLSNLTSIQYLDLSNNSLTGSVPDFLSQLPSLTVLKLEENKLTGLVPATLLDRSKNGSLKLSVSGNPDLCASVSCNKKKNKFLVPVVASVASFFVLIAALAILWILRRRKHHVGKVDSKSNRTYESYELKSRQFTYSEVQKITNNFERVLGKGGFGTVYHGYLDDTQVAVKMLSSSSTQGYKEFQAEVKLLLRVHHRNLTTLVGYCDDGTNMGLIYEYMANGNLAEHLSDSSTNVLNWKSRLQIALEAAQGLEYLHNGCKPPMVHRDVKAANILLNDKFQAKLADFGLSRTFLIETGAHMSTVISGTPGYIDPEYYILNWLNEKSDVYSFGVVLLEIISSRPVILENHDHEKTHISQWFSFMLAKGDIKNIVDPRLQGHFDINSVWKAVEIAMACVSPTSTRRPNMNHVVMELNECLATEIAWTEGAHETELKDEIIAVSVHSELTPLAR